MTRKTIDCRSVPNDVGCTLAISGEPGELVAAAAQHAVTVHGHITPELREQMRGALTDEAALTGPGAFVQLIEFGTDDIGEWDVIAGRAGRRHRRPAGRPVDHSRRRSRPGR